MEIKILKKEYLKSKNIYQNFLQDKINENLENFTDKIIKMIVIFQYIWGKIMI